MFVPCSKQKAQKKVVKSEKKAAQASTSSGSQNLEKNLKQALDDLRQKEQIEQPVAKKIINVGGALWTGNKAPSNPSSSTKKERERRRSPERENKSQRKLFENRSVNKKSPTPERRSARSREQSPPFRRCGSPRRSPPRRSPSGRRHSPEWQRQVRIVQSRDAETRRVKRVDSRSRSRSHSPRRRYFRSGSRSGSRSPNHRPRSRVSPDYPNRRWGGRGSRSPPRHRSPFGSNQRTVVISRRSRTRTPSPARNKRFKESVEEQPTQLFTRGYVARSVDQQLSVNSAASNPMVLGAPIQQQQQQISPPVLFPRFLSPPPAVQQPPPVVYPPPGPAHMFAFINHQQQQQENYRQQVAAQIHAAQVYHQQQQQQQHVAMAMAANASLGPTGQITQVPQTAPAFSHPPPVINGSSDVAQTDKATDDMARVRMARDQLLSKQSQVIEELLKLAIKQADLELKQKLATSDTERERYTGEILTNAKLENEMTSTIQSLEKILLKHSKQLKEDLEEVRMSKATHQYRYFDQQQHWCKLCDVVVEKVSDYLSHLHSKDHEERVQATGVPSSPWHRKQPPQPEDDPNREIMMIPFRGLQCIQPVKSWYCDLCDVWMGDVHCAQLHMNSTKHNDNYLKHSMERPGWAMNFAQDRQDALRRNAVRKKMQAVADRQKKEAEKKRLDAELLEIKKKREEERLEGLRKLQEKNKAAEKKWQKHIEQEEVKKLAVIELTDDRVANESASDPSPSDPAKSDTTSKSIRLNIHTPLTKPEEEEVTERTIPSIETVDVEMESKLQEEKLAADNSTSDEHNRLPEAEVNAEKEPGGVEQETPQEEPGAIGDATAMNVEQKNTKDQLIEEEKMDETEAAAVVVVEEPQEDILPPQATEDLKDSFTSLDPAKSDIVDGTISPPKEIMEEPSAPEAEVVTAINNNNQLPTTDSQIEEIYTETTKHLVSTVETSDSAGSQHSGDEEKEQVMQSRSKDSNPAAISKEDEPPVDDSNAFATNSDPDAVEGDSMDAFANQPLDASSPAVVNTEVFEGDNEKQQDFLSDGHSFPAPLSIVKSEQKRNGGFFDSIPMLIPIKQEPDVRTDSSTSCAPNPLYVSHNLISQTSTVGDVDDDDCRFLMEVKASSADDSAASSFSLELALSSESVNDSAASGDCCFVMEKTKQATVVAVIDLVPEDEPMPVSGDSANKLLDETEAQVGIDISSVDTSAVGVSNKENKVSPEISVQLCDFIVLSETGDECNLELGMEKVPLSGSLELTSAAQQEMTGDLPVDSTSTQDS